MPKFNLKATPNISDWTPSKLKAAQSIDPFIDPTTKSHKQFCQERAEHWLSQLKKP